MIIKSYRKYWQRTIRVCTPAAVTLGNLENKHSHPEGTATANQNFCNRGSVAFISSHLEPGHLAAELVRTSFNQFCIVETRSKKWAPTWTVGNSTTGWEWTFYPVPNVFEKMVICILQLYGFSILALFSWVTWTKSKSGMERSLFLFAVQGGLIYCEQNGMLLLSETQVIFCWNEYSNITNW